MSDDTLNLDDTPPVALITFNRPDKANAIGKDWTERILEFLGKVERRDDIRCVLFRANGKHFQAGGDLKVLEQMMYGTLEERLNRVASEISKWNLMIRAITRLPKPVVASIQGVTAGGSIGIIGACDLVIAAEDASIVLSQPKVGFTIDGMPSYFLPRQIGHKKAMEWALLGRRVPAQEAARLGLINFIVPKDRLEAETQALVEELARGPARAHALNKALVNASLDNTFEDQAGCELDAYMLGAATADWMEGARAFLERRSPVFKGR
jgi:2-(1,2-epoxy-1,2-dihydrophenyl)acetyl-CoA isomerase